MLNLAMQSVPLAVLRAGASMHMNHYGGKRVPYACVAAEGLRQTMVAIEGPNAGTMIETLDASGGYASACLGAGHPALKDAFLSAFPDCGYVTDELGSAHRANLLWNLFGDEGIWRDVFPREEYHVAGRNSGSEGMELALRLVLESGWDGRRLTAREDRKHRRRILAFEGAWHGWTAGVTSLLNRRHYRVGLPDGLRGPDTGFQVDFIPFGNLDLLETYFQKHGDELAAVVVEPIQGDAGIIVPPEGYLRRLSELCRSGESYLVADEVLTFAKTGRFFAMADEQGHVPTDVTVIGKSLGFGVVPVSMVIARRELVARPSGVVATCDLRPLACHLMQAGIQHVLTEGLLDRSKRLGADLLDNLREVVSEFPAVFTEARGRGFLCGLELTEVATIAGLTPLRMSLIENGVYFEFMAGAGRRSGGMRYVFPCLRVAPPLVATAGDLEEIVARLRSGVKEFSRLLKSRPR